MNLIRHTKSIKNLWASTNVALKKQIEVLEFKGILSSAFKGLELKEVRLLDLKGKIKLLADLKDLLKFSLTRTTNPLLNHN